MECIFLRGEYMKFCKAENTAYIPSGFEIAEYCETSMHRVCPFYMTAKNGVMTGAAGVVCEFRTISGQAVR